jgi:NAD(P)-dependent dehydrogenase (short-subunit alcohol dehydrogenase family)
MSQRSVWGLRMLITGAARGIGAEAAMQLAARGARPALIGLEPEELARTAARCGDAPWFECDVTDTEQLDRAVRAMADRLGGLDVVIANAGVAPMGMVRTIDPRAFERTIEINLLGAWRTVHASLPYVIKSRGYLLVVASLAAIAHAPGMAAYSASKAGLEAFADSLRAEVRHLGVDVGCAYFSFIATDMVDGAFGHPVGGALRRAMRGPLGRAYPVHLAGAAIVRGVERRGRYVVAPWWVRPLIPLRGLVTSLGDRIAAREAAALDELFAEETRRRGEEQTSALAGPGGAAAQHVARATAEPRTSVASTETPAASSR